jgi:MOSC domain-containing protein YiiM
MQGTVRALLVKREKGGDSIPLPEVHAVIGGFAGDYHTKSPKQRQILMVSGSVMDELKLPPGAIYENVVVDGIDVIALAEGQQLRMGEALLSVTIPCEPCIQMERVRLGLQDTLQNRRGIFAKVVTPGLIRVSDSVEIL